MIPEALQNLEGRLGEIRLLSGMDPLRDGGSSDPTRSSAINRACIVLLSAHLEGFLEDLVTEAIDLLVANGAQVDRLPLCFRSMHVEEHLREIESIKDRNSRAPRIARMFEAESKLWVAGSQLTATMVRAKTICGQMDNPGSRQIQQFLQLLDVDIRGYLQTVGQGDMLDRINGLISRRNAIAHGEVSASATHADVDHYVALVDDLAKVIVEAVGESIQDICLLTARPW